MPEPRVSTEGSFASRSPSKRSTVIARSEATKQSMLPVPLYGLLRFARNDGLEFRVVDRLVTIERARDRRQRILKPCRAIEQHHAIIFRDATVGEALLVSGIGRSALRAQQQALFARHFIERSRNLLILDRNGETLALAHCAQDQKISDRLRDADTRRDGMGIFPARSVLGACFKS